jgi:HNH endonuclease/Protein of unknown function (DUF1376)
MTDTLPDPLVPADCDLRDFPFMPLEVQRLRDSDLAALEGPEACWAAVLLWCVAWHQMPAASLPDDDRLLARFAGYQRAPREWKRIRDGALRGWVKCSDGRMYHPVVAEKANRLWNSPRRVSARVDRRLEIVSAEWAAIRRAVFERDDFTCRYCGVRGARLECDHVLPVAKGGKTEMSNLVTACFPCNRSKGARPLTAWMAQ